MGWMVPNHKTHRILTIFWEAHKVESFFDKSVDYLAVTSLEMESTLTILMQVSLKATNVDFFVYKTTWFIHVAYVVLLILIDFVTLLEESRWYLVKVQRQYDRKYTNH